MQRARLFFSILAPTFLLLCFLGSLIPPSSPYFPFILSIFDLWDFDLSTAFTFFLILIGLCASTLTLSLAYLSENLTHSFLLLFQQNAKKQQARRRAHGFVLHKLISKKNQKEERNCLKQLPFYLDTLALCLQAGMNLQNALKFVTSKAPAGRLQLAFVQLINDLHTGQSWAKAWQRMAEKVPLIEIAQLSVLLIQAEQFGLPIVPILQTQSAQCRHIYFSQAEKKALETPVKMLLPLVLFIFPCSFIVFAFPLTHQLLFLWQS